GVTAVEIRDAPGGLGPLCRDTVNFAGRAATSLALGGDLLYVGTVNGTVEVVDVSDPANLKAVGSVSLPGSPAVNDVALSGFLLYVATSAGTTVLALDDVKKPDAPFGAAGIKFVGPASQGIYVFQGLAYVAAGAQGV